MATPIDIDINLTPPDLGPTVNGFKELKNQLRDQIGLLANLTEGTDEYVRQAARVGQIRDQVNALNDAVRNTSGAPVENLTSSFGLLSGQVNNLNFEGAATSLRQFGAGAGQIKFKDLTDGIKGFGKAALDVGKSILLNPLFLIPALIIGIGAGLFALKDKIKPLGVFFDFIGNQIEGTIQNLKNLGDFIGLTSFAAEKLLKTQEDAAKALKEKETERYDNLIKLAEAEGKSTTNLQKQKTKIILEETEKQIKAIINSAKVAGKFTEDQLKQIGELRKEITNAVVTENVESLKAAKKAADELEKKTKETADKNKKAAEELLTANKAARKQLDDLRIASIQDEETRAIESVKNAAKYRDIDIAASKASIELKKQLLIASETSLNNDINKIQKDAAKKKDDELKEIAEKNKADEEKRLADITENNKKIAASAFTDLQAQAEANLIEKDKNSRAELEAQLALNDINMQVELANTDLTEGEKARIKATYRQQNLDAEKAYYAEVLATQLQTAQDGVNALQGLSDLVFSIKFANLKKGSAAEEAAARKQFLINKALQLTGAAINGAQAITTSLASAPPVIGVAPNPAGIAALVGIGLTTAATIAKIAATQFNPGTATAPAGGSTASGLSAGSVSSPSPQSSAFNPATVGQVGGVGAQSASNQPQRVYVVESDITNTQNKVSVAESQASF